MNENPKFVFPWQVLRIASDSYFSDDDCNIRDISDTYNNWNISDASVRVLQRCAIIGAKTFKLAEEQGKLENIERIDIGDEFFSFGESCSKYSMLNPTLKAMPLPDGMLGKFFNPHSGNTSVQYSIPFAAHSFAVSGDTERFSQFFDASLIPDFLALDMDELFRFARFKLMVDSGAIILLSVALDYVQPLYADFATFAFARDRSLYDNFLRETLPIYEEAESQFVLGEAHRNLLKQYSKNENIMEFRTRPKLAVNEFTTPYMHFCDMFASSFYGMIPDETFVKYIKACDKHFEEFRNHYPPNTML